MMNFKKYKRVPVLDYPNREWPDKEIKKAPAWCSVDLRDGNQALIDPMTVDEKIEMFQLLLKLGFKEIEIGFPAASQIEYDFLRKLVEENMIPDDVTVQVLTQCREHLIDRTFEAIEGIKNVIVHIYNSTSVLQRDVVFHMDKEAIKQIAIDGTNMVKERMKNCEGNITLEYSPESFTGTEMEFALDICSAVQKTWDHANDNKIIFNLPATVEMTTPNVYADQIEWMNKHFEDRDNIILSVHPHNDRGTGVAATELALLAGADRVEGTLFGNGERTGNVDILTLAYNMFSQGINPGLELGNINEIREVYERCCKMKVGMRHPYAGKLVFTAFSGSHQDAINKGIHAMNERGDGIWEVPYLPIDPSDLGRQYEPIVRINSQSGKGGVSYLMETKYGYHIPQKMRESFGYLVKGVSDHAHKELLPEEVLDIFTKHYVNVETPVSIPEVHFVQKGENAIGTEATISYKGSTETVHGDGNGRLDAVSNAVKAHLNMDFSLTTYTEHALEVCSNSKAVAYVGLEKNGKTYWGVGVHSDIINSSISAFLSALNAMLMDLKK